jgi:hypothetical protein
LCPGVEAPEHHAIEDPHGSHHCGPRKRPVCMGIGTAPCLPGLRRLSKHPVPPRLTPAQQASSASPARVGSALPRLRPGTQGYPASPDWRVPGSGRLSRPPRLGSVQRFLGLGWVPKGTRLPPIGTSPARAGSVCATPTTSSAARKRGGEPGLAGRTRTHSHPARPEAIRMVIDGGRSACYTLLLRFLGGVCRFKKF